MLKSRNEEEIVYSEKVGRRIGAIFALIVLGSMTLYVHEQLLHVFGLILCLCLFIHTGYWGFSLFRRWRDAFNPNEIIMDRRNQMVIFRFRHFLTVPTNVNIFGKEVTKVVVDRMEWQGITMKYWRVWLHTPDRGQILIDQGHKKRPVRLLAADLAEVLHVPLLQIF